MKKILLALAFVAVASVARAGTPVSVEISSAIVSGLSVTTGTVIRVDNWNKGASQTDVNYSTKTTIIANRIGITIQNQDSADNIYCDYNATVSTAAASAQVGTLIEPGDNAYFACPNWMYVYCQAVDAAGASGVRVNLKQYGRY